MLKEKKISIVIFPGSNCDRDLFVALEKCLGTKPEIIWHNCSHIKSTDMILIPGGFSFGDYLRAGIIATKSPAIKEVIRFSKRGVPIIGICNGFQILTECGLLEGALIKNSNQLFKCEKVNLKVINNKTIFTKNYKLSEIISLPIAHSQGNYFIKPDKLKKIEDNDQIIFKYSSDFGEVTEKYNPNGSVSNIAGISNKKKNVIEADEAEYDKIENFHNGIDGIKFFKNLKDLI